MGRAEMVKKRIEEQKKLGLYHEQIIIEDNSTGHSFDKVFGRFFDEDVAKIEIDDPYIRLFHQVISWKYVISIFLFQTIRKLKYSFLFIERKIQIYPSD